jgi:hypothetical protein
MKLAINEIKIQAKRLLKALKSDEALLLIKKEQLKKAD